MEDKAQLRNLRDFLSLYNNITEMCFKSCVVGLLNRTADQIEEQCIDSCVKKFANVNQRLMGTYVEVQTDINNRKVAEFEEAQHKHQADQQALNIATETATSEEIIN